MDLKTAPFLIFLLVTASLCNPAVQEEQAAALKTMMFDSGDVSISYRVAGAGNPVVLLHGALLDAASNWRLVTDSLSGHFQVISLDLRGHGQSGKPTTPDAYGAELYRDVLRLMDHLDVKTAHFVGYSLGGQLALNIAAEHPDRVRTLTIGGAGWMPPDSSGSGEAFAQAIESSESVADVLAPDSLSIPEEVRAVLAANDVLASAAMARGPWHEITMPAEELGKLPFPVHVIVGEMDSIRTQVDQFLEILPGTTVEVLPELDHITTFLSPAFASAVVDRLEQVES